jgi:hypothetical protein
MIREFLANLHWSTLPVVSMFLFISVFVGAVFWVYRQESTEVYRDLGALPLEGEGK